MEINITTEKTKALVAGDHGVTKEFIKVEISDQDLLKLGKRYFELASGKECINDINAYTWEIAEGRVFTFRDDSAAMVAARGLKNYCNSKTNCKDCQFCSNPLDTDKGGTYHCMLNMHPYNWEV